MSIFYDTHAHLDYPDYAADLPQVIERAQAAGIEKIITIGTDLESSARAIKLADQFPPVFPALACHPTNPPQPPHQSPAVFAAVGWHPTNAAEAPDDLRPALRELVKHPKVVAIGETGLDYHHLPGANPGGTPADDERYKQKQAAIFRQQMEVAAESAFNSC